MIEQETILKLKDVVFYVSNGGNDSNDGLTSDKPFLTLQKACDAALVYTYEAYKLDNKTNVLASIKILTSITAESGKTYTDNSLASITNTHSSEYIPNITITRSFISDGVYKLDGAQLVRIIKAKDVNLTVSEIELTNGVIKGDGGGIYFENSENKPCSMYLYSLKINTCGANNGGGIYCKNFVTIMTSSLTLTNCSASINGGGICSDTSATQDPGTIIFYNANINNCAAVEGGGIYMGSNNLLFPNTTFTLADNTSTNTMDTEPNPIGADIYLDTSGLDGTTSQLCPFITFYGCTVNCTVNNAASSAKVYILPNSEIKAYPYILLKKNTLSSIETVAGSLEINMLPTDAKLYESNVLFNIDTGANFPANVFTLDSSLEGYGIDTKTGTLNYTVS